MSRQTNPARRSRIRLGLAAAAPLVVVAVIAAVAVSGAAGSPTQATKPLGTFVYRNAQDWNTFDAYVDAGRATNFAFISPGYDKLVSFGPQGGNKYVPYLASSWKQTAKSVLFHVRKDAKCTDGHVLTAVDMLNSIKRFLFVPKRSGAVASNAIGGFGKGPYNLHANNQAGTLFMSVESPWRNLLGAFAQFPIICPSGLSALSSDSRYLETHIAGSGPYELVSATHGDSVVWKLRPEWKWGPPGTSAKKMPAQVIMKIVPDDTTAANLLLTKGLSMGVVSGPDTARLNSASSLSHQTVTNYSVTFLAFNMRPGRLTRDDEGVRQAVMTLIDPAKANQAAYSGAGTVAKSIIRPGGECHDPKAVGMFPKTNPDKAKQILQEDGWTFTGGRWKKGGQTLSLTLVTTPLLNAMPDYLQQAISSIGIDVNLQNLVGSAYGATVLAGNFDLAVSRSVVVAPDAGFGQVFSTGSGAPGGQNVGGTVPDDVLNRLVGAAYQNPGKGGCKYWALVQQRINQHAYVDALVAPNLDLYTQKGIVVPPYSPDSSAFPLYYIHPAGR